MLSDKQQVVLDRFVGACKRDGRVLAAFIGGSFAAGTADAHSDLDLYLITTDASYDSFFAERAEFLGQLGRPVFLQDFSGFGFDMVIFMFSDGVEGELAMASEERYSHIHGGPFSVLVDKNALLEDAVFPWQRPSAVDQRETLCQLLEWYWRDLSLFNVAIARQRLWTAYGYLEAMRLKCVNLARLSRDMKSWADGYEKLEGVLGDHELDALGRTLCSLDRADMMDAAQSLIGFYRSIALPLSRRQGITYPSDLDEIVSGQLRSTASPIGEGDESDMIS